VTDQSPDDHRLPVMDLPDQREVTRDLPLPPRVALGECLHHVGDR